MTQLAAGLIDVFAETPFGGNPLAVVEDADGLSDAQMRRIAGEFNQAETTFLLQSDRADRKLRRSPPAARKCSVQATTRSARGCGWASTASWDRSTHPRHSGRKSAATCCPSRW